MSRSHLLSLGDQCPLCCLVRQSLVFEPIRKGKNILLTSPTGTGKTLSVILPVLSNLIESEYKPIS
ncbi:MAG: DEAD/DEAH box helicase, partial [Nanoarchaeota archaeon]|nr:DEAD/DEAH box helicase [Nanoarchaeota archaeon]